MTPLQYAALEGELEVCKLLMAAGADVTHVDEVSQVDGHTSIKRHGNKRIYAYLTTYTLSTVYACIA